MATNTKFNFHLIWLILFLFSGIFKQNICAQNMHLDVQDNYVQFIQKLDLKYQLDLTNTLSIQPLNIKKINKTIIENYDNLTEFDQKEALKYLAQTDIISSDNSLEIRSEFYSKDFEQYTQKSGFLNYFYKNPHHFWSLDKENFKLRVNPVIDFSGGNANNYDNVVFNNSRGIKISALIDDKISVYTSIYENQTGFLPHVNDLIQKRSIVPGNGLYKSYKSRFSDKINGLDYLNAQAYLSIPISKSISLDFGHGNHFYGHGQRSLFLGNFANNYLFGKFDANFWKFKYQSLYAELNVVSANSGLAGQEVLPKKYFSSHYFIFRPSQKFEVGLFESVVFSRQNHLELQYLNPVILFRTIEHFMNSPDNVMVGINAKYNFTKKWMVYSQFLLDEFALSILKDDINWWGNKYGIQLGLKAADFVSVKNLDLLIEYNSARPFTYSHYQRGNPLPNNITVANYTHYGQELAHPLGANFREILGRAQYRINHKMLIEGAYFYWAKGLDKDNKSYGGNLLLDYNLRPSDSNVKTLQGLRSDVHHVRGNVSYEFYPNAFIDLTTLYRKENHGLTYGYVGLGFRMNTSIKTYDF